MGTGADTVLIQFARPGGGPRLFEVRRDQEVTFGRGVAEAPVDVPLDDPAAEPVAGRIRAARGFWLISNLSADRSFVVENHEGGGEFLKVPPGRLDMPVPFEFARVVLPSSSGLLSLVVTAPEPAYLDPPPAARAQGDRMAAAFSLDESAKYFLVLVALCEPRLRDAWSSVIPNAPEVVARLRRLHSCRAITRAAVNFHIDYLAGDKLRVKDRDTARPGSRADWQREALVSLALRFGVVRPDHLALLPAG